MFEAHPGRAQGSQAAPRWRRPAGSPGWAWRSRPACRPAPPPARPSPTRSALQGRGSMARGSVHCMSCSVSAGQCGSPPAVHSWRARSALQGRGSIAPSRGGQEGVRGAQDWPHVGRGSIARQRCPPPALARAPARKPSQLSSQGQAVCSARWLGLASCGTPAGPGQRVARPAAVAAPTQAQLPPQGTPPLLSPSPAAAALNFSCTQGISWPQLERDAVDGETHL